MSDNAEILIQKIQINHKQPLPVMSEDGWNSTFYFGEMDNLTNWSVPPEKNSA